MIQNEPDVRAAAEELIRNEGAEAAARRAIQMAERFSEGHALREYWRRVLTEIKRRVAK